MDLSEIITVKINRTSRDSRPYLNYRNSFKKYSYCLEFVEKLDEENSEIKNIIINSVIINQVTSIEVYCKDILDACFKIVNPEFYLSNLKELHKNKYDIDDLLFMYKNSVHPLELISYNQSFQNLPVIDSFFSKLLKAKIFENIKSLKLRFKDSPESTVTFDDPAIFKMTDLLFNTRHELVHNPSSNKKLESNKVREMLAKSDILIFALDVILTNLFETNK